MDAVRAYDEVVDFIAGGVSPSDVAGFEASDQTKKRVGVLIHREKTVGLSSEEESELDHYMAEELRTSVAVVPAPLTTRGIAAMIDRPAALAYAR